MQETKSSPAGAGSLDQPFRGEWSAYEASPGATVILLGCQRSGTTLLHLQLARSGAFRFLSACDTYAADRLVYNARHGLQETERANFAGLLHSDTANRGIDKIPAGPDTPEEYGLVIANSGLPRLRYEQPDTTEQTLPALRELCAKKALIEGRERPLLLKSPPDYPGAIPQLQSAFPQARFIVIQRHPLPTLQSQVRSWREAILRRNSYLALIDPAYRALMDDSRRRMSLGLFLHSEAGVEWLADCILNAHVGFLSFTGVLADRMVSVRYEDLCVRQTAEFERISAFLGLQLQPPLEDPAPAAQRVSDEVLQAYRKRVDRFAPYLDYCGYEVEPE
jgi:hypothetical protein